MLSAAALDATAPPLAPVPEPSQQGADDTCRLCGADEAEYLFISHGAPVYRCAACGLMGLLPRAAARANARRRDELGSDPTTEFQSPPDSQTELEAARHYADVLMVGARPGSSVLVVAPTGHPVSGILAERGYDVSATFNIRELEAAMLPRASFDYAMLAFQLEKSGQPVAVLQRVQAALRPGGRLLVATPSTDSWPAKVLQERWTEWRPDNLTYFNPETLQNALIRAGFERVRADQDRRRYSLEHIHERACTFPRTALTRLIKVSVPFLPQAARSAIRLELPTSCMVVTATRAEPRPRPMLSVVMPVYNERHLFEQTIEQVLAKQVPGMDKELVIVESNSTDGTREVVEQYRDHPGVTVILQDRACGKGNAVREGLARASGDIVLVQDADQEYDVDDYDALVKPLLQHQRSFVLGSRHHGNWKIRDFDDKSGSAGVLNIGHLVFQFLLNLLYFQRLRDPFTMYKVFRRDCISDIAFECDRFDFDFELVIKLLRKGYRPLEIPISYNARSFAEGKKVSLFRDPITWLRALVRYRIGSIYVDGRR